MSLCVQTQKTMPIREYVTEMKRDTQTVADLYSDRWSLMPLLMMKITAVVYVCRDG